MLHAMKNGMEERMENNEEKYRTPNTPSCVGRRRCVWGLMKGFSDGLLTKRIYDGECIGNRPVGRPRKKELIRWLIPCTKEAWMLVKQGKWCMTKMNSGGFWGRNVWGLARGMMTWIWRNDIALCYHSCMKPIWGGRSSMTKSTAL